MTSFFMIARDRLLSFIDLRVLDVRFLTQRWNIAYNMACCSESLRSDTFSNMWHVVVHGRRSGEMTFSFVL